MTPRENFGSRFAVIMAMAGSAVGLGNIWRFPYMVGEHGGAAFVILYMIASFILVLPPTYQWPSSGLIAAQLLKI